MFASNPKSLFTATLLDGTANSGIQDARRGQLDILPYAKGSDGRIREMFKKVELSVSSYDTAWVAKIPSPDSPQQPYFPECLNWILENQLPDGSWSLPCRGKLLVKDSIQSTLASILALKRWEVGEVHVRRGVNYIESNFGAINDKKQLTPVGFDIIFPSMIETANHMGLRLPLETKLVDVMLQNRYLEYERLLKCNSKLGKGYIASICDGLDELYDWKEIKKYQRKNGSVANSPSATAAFLMRSPDTKGLEYLRSLLDMFGSAVPTLYPMNVYIRLCMVDQLERLGIHRHFRNEIKYVLDETYRDEEILLDMETCALAIRLLRTNGYEISSDALSEFEKEEYPYNRPSQNLKDVSSVLELHKASEIMTSQDELVLVRIHSWTSKFLFKELSNSTAAQDEKCYKEVDHALKHSYNTIVPHLESRRNIELYRADEICMLKTSYRCSNINNIDFLNLAAEDYNFCQAIHQRELNNIEGWIKANRLDDLKFARQRETFAYFMIAAILPSPELSDARVSWTKYVALISVIDDLFDFKGRREELVNLIELVEKWECDSICNYYSEPVEIIFRALYQATNELGDNALPLQRRSVTHHLVDLWITILKSMLKEHDQARDTSAPTLEIYLEYAHITIAVKLICLSTLYLLGPNISEEIIVSPEYNILSENVGTCCRLLNDLQSFKREAEQGKLNSVLLCMIHGHGAVVSEQEAVKQVRDIISRINRETLSLVLKTKRSVMPRVCKDLLWNTNRIGEYMYREKDGFSFPQKMAGDMNAVLRDPINISCSTL